MVLVRSYVIENMKDLQALILEGPTRENLFLDPLAVLKPRQLTIYVQREYPNGFTFHKID